MTADLHHQLRDLFDELANELDPVVPDHFDPHRPTAISLDAKPDRRRPLLAAAAAITLVTGTTIVLTQRHPHTPENPPVPATTTTVDTTTTTIPTSTATTAPAPTTTSTVGSPTTVPADADGTPPAHTIPLPRTLGLTGQAHFLPDGQSVLVADTPTSYGFDVERGVVDVQGDDEASSFVVDLATGDVVHEFPWGIGPLVIAADGSRFFDGLSLWDLTTGDEIGDQIGVTGFTSTSSSTAFSPDGTLLATVVDHLADSLDLRLVNAVDGTTIWHAEAAIGFTAGLGPQVRFSDDATRIYLGDQIHDIATGDRLEGTAPADTGREDGFWSPDVVNVVDGTLEDCLRAIRPCDISADGASIVTVGSSGDTLQVWHIDQVTSRPLDRGIAPTHRLEVHEPSFYVRFLPAGDAVLVSNSNGQTEFVYDLATGTVLHQFPGDSGNGSLAPKLFSPDGTRYFDGEHLFDVTSGVQIASWQTPTFAAGFSPDSSRFAIGTGAMTLVDAATGDTLWEGVSAEYTFFTTLRFSDDGREIYLPGQIIDTETGAATLASPPSAEVHSQGFWDPALVDALDAPRDSCDPSVAGEGFGCDITADGSKIAMLVDGVVFVWELEP